MKSSKYFSSVTLIFCKAKKSKKKKNATITENDFLPSGIVKDKDIQIQNIIRCERSEHLLITERGGENSHWKCHKKIKKNNIRF